jgi:hypothetical protein
LRNHSPRSTPRLTLRQNKKLLIHAANSGDELLIGDRLRIRRDITFAGRLCNRARRTEYSRRLRPRHFAQHAATALYV